MLPSDMTKVLRVKFRSDEDATESAPLDAGLPPLFIPEPVVGCWLHYHVGPAIDALNADSSRELSLDQIRTRLADEHARWTR